MKKKILVIEDEQNIIESIETLLEEEGYQIFSAINGKYGAKIAQEILPDLIICDIMMPEKDGYTVFKELSENPKTKLIPFLFLTAKVEPKDLRKGMEMGADDYIFKPFRSEELLSAIKVRLKKSELRNANINNKIEKEQKLKESDSIFVTINEEAKFLKLEKIKYIEADNQYTNIILADGKKYNQRKSLNKWENYLPETIFLRIHRSTIININYIQKIEKWFNYSMRIFLTNTQEPLIVSKRYTAKIKELF